MWSETLPNHPFLYAFVLCQRRMKAFLYQSFSNTFKLGGVYGILDVAIRYLTGFVLPQFLRSISFFYLSHTHFFLFLCRVTFWFLCLDTFYSFAKILWNLVTSKYLGCFLAKMSKFWGTQTWRPVRAKALKLLTIYKASAPSGRAGWYQSYRRACWIISIIQEGVLGEFICPGLRGSSEGPKRETARL